jgi:hypothetical protein
VIEDLPQEVKQAWAIPVHYPKIICRKVASNDCYRISGKEQIDSSMDAGKSWKRTWRFPVGRKEFVNRNSRLALSLPDPPNEKLEPDTIPKDILILDLPDGYLVIAALGNQGILIQNNGGIWERLYLSKALPLSYTLTKLEEIDDHLFNELFLSGCISALLLTIITGFFVFSKKKLLPWITPVIVFICLLVPFILWAYGIVPIYEIALAGAVVLSGGVLVRGYFSTRSKERAMKTD